MDGLEERLHQTGRNVTRTRQSTTEARETAAFRYFLFEPVSQDDIDYRALLCLMIGDRIQHLHRIVAPALRRGDVVLCDRYIFTQMVTTVTRVFEDEPWMLDLYQHVLAPHVGIIADAPVDVAIDRIARSIDSWESFYEADHVRADLRAHRDIAGIYGLLVLDTHETSAASLVESSRTHNQPWTYAESSWPEPRHSAACGSVDQQAPCSCADDSVR